MKCERKAAYAVFWPGKDEPIPMCEPHYEVAKNIARVCDFQLPISVVTDETCVCEQDVGEIIEEV